MFVHLGRWARWTGCAGEKVTRKVRLRYLLGALLACCVSTWSFAPVLHVNCMIAVVSLQWLPVSLWIRRASKSPRQLVRREWARNPPEATPQQRYCQTNLLLCLYILH